MTIYITYSISCDPADSTAIIYVGLDKDKALEPLYERKTIYPDLVRITLFEESSDKLIAQAVDGSTGALVVEKWEITSRESIFEQMFENYRK